MRDAAEAGADSLLIADVPALEAEPFAREMAQAGIEPVLIAAANTPDATLRAHRRARRRPTPIASAAPGSPAPHAGGQFDAGLIARLHAKQARRRRFSASESRGPSMSAPRSRPARPA